MQKSHLVTLAILFAILCAAGAATYLIYVWPKGEAESDAGKTLATSETQAFTDLEGNPFTFDAFAGKVRVVNSWASWTPFSATELHSLESLASSHDAKHVVFVAVNRKESKEIAKSYLATLGGFEHLQFAIDVNAPDAGSIGGYAMPETVIYDASGAIIFHKRGPATPSELEEYILQATALLE